MPNADKPRPSNASVPGTGTCCAGVVSTLRVLSLAAAGYVNLVRAVPLVLVIFWFYFLVPYIGQRINLAPFFLCHLDDQLLLFQCAEGAVHGAGPIVTLPPLMASTFCMMA